MPRTNISALIVDTQTLLHPALSRVQIPLPSITFVMAHDYAEAEKQAGQIFPDIIWLDINMGNGNGIAEIRCLKELSSTSRILAITWEENEQEAFAAIMAGAQGYGSRETISLEEIEALYQVLVQDEYVIRPELLPPLMQHLRSKALWQPGQAPGSPPSQSKSFELSHLSSQERKIVQLIIQGYRDSDIARKLHLSEYTVTKLVWRIMNKLGL